MLSVLDSLPWHVPKTRGSQIADVCSKRKGEGSEALHPLARSVAKESGEPEPEGVALALEREVRRYPRAENEEALVRSGSNNALSR